MKKTLAILLSLALVICMIPATDSVAFAETNLDAFTVELAPGVPFSYEYTGAEIKPEVSVSKDGNPLRPNVDYTVSYDNNINAGSEPIVTIKGKGDYAGEVTANGLFSIAAKSIEKCEIEAADIGPGETPQITVKNGDALLVPNRDYTVSEVDTNKPIGTTVSVTITASEDNYTGTAYATFDIAKTIKNAVISGVSSSYTYTGKPITPDVNLYLDGKLVPSRDYSVVYSNNVNASTTYSKGTVTIVPATDSGYAGTCSTTFDIMPRDMSYCTIEFTSGKDKVSYTGYNVTPAVEVKLEFRFPLTPNTDYTLEFKDESGETVSSIKEAGTYRIIATGKGNYTGTQESNFIVRGTSIKEYTVTLKETFAQANGDIITPVISSVKYGNTSSLTSNDYTVSYQDSNGNTVTYMSAPGTYKVIVTGKNGYTGSTSTTFKIVGLAQTVIVEKDSYKVYTTSDYFRIDARATGEYSGFIYTSSNPAVASVSSAGYVTPKKVGRAVITVTAVGKNKYESASKTVEVKVYPSKVKLSNKPWTAGKKAQLKVRWGYQDGVTKYQVRYSRDKNFKAGTYLTKTVKAHGKDYTTQSTTLTKLKRGYTYYVKVRAVYTDPVTGDNYYGSWSGWRSAKTI